MAADPLIYPRSAYDAAPPTEDIPNLAYPVPRAYLHHEGSPRPWTSLNIDDERRKMKQLQQYMMSKGYADLAYGPVGFPSGRFWEGRDLDFVDGGELDREAATGGDNEHSIAFLWVGNYALQRPTRELIVATARVFQLGQFVGRIARDAPLLPHSAARGTTSCPERYALEALPEVRALIQSPAPTAPPPKENDMIVYPRRMKPMGGRIPAVSFDPTTKTVAGRNGVRFAKSPGWEITTWPDKNPTGVTQTAVLTVATLGALEFAERPDGTGVVVTALGDSGTFILDYDLALLQPDKQSASPQRVDIPALAAAVAPRLKLTAS